jgi:lambda repressor-like predicted transcriptional regulator
MAKKHHPSRPPVEPLGSPHTVVCRDALGAALVHSGLTRGELAKRACVAAKTIKNWLEEPTSRVRKDRLERVAQSLGISVEALTPTAHLPKNLAAAAKPVFRQVGGNWHVETQDFAVKGAFHYPNGSKKASLDVVLMQNETGKVNIHGIDHTGDEVTAVGQLHGDGTFLTGSYAIANARMSVHGVYFLKYSLCGTLLEGWALQRETGHGADIVLGKVCARRVEDSAAH